MLGLFCTVLSIFAQTLVTWGRSALETFTESYRWVMRQADIIASVCASMVVAAMLLGLVAGEVKSAVSLAGFSREAAIILAVGVLAFAFAKVRAWLADVLDVLPMSGSVRRAGFVTEVLWTIGGVAIAVTMPVLGATLC